jgi:putative ABC transport system permease protein
MARAAQEQGGASRLVALKSVEPGYPLRGVLHLNQGRASQIWKCGDS